MITKSIRIILMLWFASVIPLDTDASSPYYGIPGIRNFSRAQYSGGIQNWSFTETDNGLLYFANNSGLIEYNGARWKVYQSVKAVHRAVYADGNRIYVGAFNDFGYYEENERGNLLYHSLTHLLQGKIGDFDEIWRIHKTSFGIVFQSFKAIFIYHNDKIDIVYPPSNFHFSFYVNDVLWVYDEQNGLMQCKDGKILPVNGGEYFAGTQIWSVLPLNHNEIIIGTAKKGLFRFDGSNISPWGSTINQKLKTYQLYAAKRLRNNYFAFGTIQNGLIVTDTEGNIVTEMNKERGLQNNTVLDIGQDYSGNIWLCLDNGISMIEFDSPISYFQNYFDIGTLYSSARSGDKIYLGTNQGLFYIKVSDFIDPSKSKSSFRLIQGTEGQVWNLSVIDNTIFCGHKNGVFVVQGDIANKISSIQGAWNFLKPDKTALILVGTYAGLSILENRGGSWQFRNTIKGFSESSRFVQADDKGTIWVGHTYKGIFRITIDSEWRSVLNKQFYNSKNGLPSDQANSLFRIQSELFVASTKGIYSFNHKTDKFGKASKFTSYFDKDIAIDYLYQDSQQNIWFCADKHIGVLRLQEDGSYKMITVPFRKLNDQIVPSFVHIKEVDQNNVLIGLEGGFANYLSKYNKDYTKTCIIYISDLRSSDTTEGIFRYNGKRTSQTLIPSFKHKNNNISISFAANNFESEEMGFQYKLDGFDADWSEWTNENFKEYTNLPDGQYTFIIRARNNFLTAPSELSYTFIIMPPWYRSVYAWVVYSVLFILLIYLGKRYFDYRIKKSRHAEYLKQHERFLSREQKLKEEVLIAEKEMQRLRNETLKIEMIHKEKELANSTMLLIKKNDILNKLQSDLQSIYSSLDNELARNKINSLIRQINKEIDNEKQWKVFNMHIEQVYEELVKKLKENFPELTPRELNLCTYLRMNMSSKEIATLMNISARGVEIGRYRLRKKLGLDRDANLTEFMMNL
ncbi:MAG: triple tyrosine motif-containing protein [Bacteroidales bacterium]